MVKISFLNALLLLLTLATDTAKGQPNQCPADEDFLRGLYNRFREQYRNERTNRVGQFAVLTVNNADEGYLESYTYLAAQYEAGDGYLGHSEAIISCDLEEMLERYERVYNRQPTTLHLFTLNSCCWICAYTVANLYTNLLARYPGLRLIVGWWRPYRIAHEGHTTADARRIEDEMTEMLIEHGVVSLNVRGSHRHRRLRHRRQTCDVPHPRFGFDPFNMVDYCFNHMVAQKRSVAINRIYDEGLEWYKEWDSSRTVLFYANADRKHRTMVSCQVECLRSSSGMGGLASIGSSEEWRMAFDRFDGNNRARSQNVVGAWLGGVRRESEWRWLNGERFHFTQWATGEPNNSTGDENCIILRSGGGNDFQSANWNDVSCNGFGDVQLYCMCEIRISLL